MPTQPISKSTADHYTWGQGCDGWFLLKEENVHIIEERMPPGAFEKRHHHKRARQFAYVLEGELTFEIDGITHTLKEHEGIEIAPGLKHQAFNKSGDDVRFLMTSVPPSRGDRIDE